MTSCCLRVLYSDGRLASSTLGLGDNVLGKEAGPYRVAIDSDAVSRHHCCIHVGTDGCTVHDMESTNGTLLASKGEVTEVEPGFKYPIRNHDSLFLGDVEITFMESDPAADGVASGEPDEQAVARHALELGMQLPNDDHLLWIAEASLTASLPENWKTFLDGMEREFYFNSDTGHKTFTRPQNIFYGALYKEMKRKQAWEEENSETVDEYQLSRMRLMSKDGVEIMHYILPGDNIIGKDAASCDVVVDSLLVSKQHCNICDVDGRVFVNDLESTNETLLVAGDEAQALVPGSWYSLMDGDVVVLADLEIVIETPVTGSPRPQVPATQRRPVQTLPKAFNRNHTASEEGADQGFNGISEGLPSASLAHHAQSSSGAPAGVRAKAPPTPDPARLAAQQKIINEADILEDEEEDSWSQANVPIDDGESVMTGGSRPASSTLRVGSAHSGASRPASSNLRVGSTHNEEPDPNNSDSAGDKSSEVPRPDNGDRPTVQDSVESTNVMSANHHLAPHADLQSVSKLNIHSNVQQNKSAERPAQSDESDIHVDARQMNASRDGVIPRIVVPGLSAADASLQAEAVQVAQKNDHRQSQISNRTSPRRRPPSATLGAAARIRRAMEGAQPAAPLLSEDRPLIPAGQYTAPPPLSGLLAFGGFRVSETALVTILSFLDPLPHLATLGSCTRFFRHVCYNPDLWPQLTLSSQPTLTSKSLAFGLAARSCRNLKELNLSGTSAVRDGHLVLMSRVCCNLQKLNLDRKIDFGPQVTSAGLRALVGVELENLDDATENGGIDASGTPLPQQTGCTKLNSLSIRYCSEVEDDGVKSVLLRCHSLTELNVRCCHKLSNELLPILGASTQLRRLDLESCSRFSEQYLADNIPKLVNLRSLSLAGLVAGVTNTVAISAAASLRALNIIDLTGLHGLTDAAIWQVSRGCPFVTELSLSWCVGVSDVSVQQISMHCPLLVQLWMRGIPKLTDRGVQAIATKCGHLKYLDIRDCSGVGQKSLDVLAQILPACVVDFTMRAR